MSTKILLDTGPVNQKSQTVHESVKDDEFDAVNLSRDERKGRLLDVLADIYIDDSESFDKL